MMHVMQPVVLDTGWSTSQSLSAAATSLTSSSSHTAAGVTATVAGNLMSTAMTDFVSMVNNQQQMSSAMSFKTSHAADASNVTSLTGGVQQQFVSAAPSAGKPPKKPITPYVRFSKTVWPDVRQAHPGRSVCDLGSLIGRMWRELKDIEKQPYFEAFSRAKVEYDKEVKVYLDANGLKPSDLVKPKVRKKDVKKSAAVQGESVAVDNDMVALVNGARGLQPAWAEPRHPATAATAAVSTAKDSSDDLLVYHVRADGTQECYVQRAARAAGLKPATTGVASGTGQLTEREVLLSALTEQSANVRQLQLQLMNARRRAVELQQQNELLRQLRDASQPSTR